MISKFNFVVVLIFIALTYFKSVDSFGIRNFRGNGNQLINMLTSNQHDLFWTERSADNLVDNDSHQDDHGDQNHNDEIDEFGNLYEI